MRNKKPLGLLCLTVLLLLSVTSLNFANAQVPKTKISIYDPKWESNISTANINETFTIEIRISDVTELVGWQFSLQWNASILDFVEVTEGPFLNHLGSYPSDFGPVRKPGDTGWNYNDTIYVSDSLINPTREMAASTVTGPGVLATVKFRVKAEGISPFHFRREGEGTPAYPSGFETMLIAWYPPGGTLPGGVPKIAHTTEDGYFILPGPIISVDPEEVLGGNYTAGTDFDIKISISNVNSLYNWSLGFRWNPAILDAIAVNEGLFLNPFLNRTTEFLSKINGTAGFLTVSDTLVGSPLGGVSGNGTLATVTFLVKAKGQSELDFFDTKLFKSDGTFILHVSTGGSFSNVNRDVAITKIDVAPTSVRTGESVAIQVTAQNLGELKESFDVTVYYDDKTIGSSSVSDLPPGNSTTLTINWDTRNVAASTYTITAKANKVPGEVNLDNNVFTAASKVTVSGGSFDITMPLLIGGVAIAAVGGVGGVFLYRRRSKSRNKS